MRTRKTLEDEKAKLLKEKLEIERRLEVIDGKIDFLDANPEYVLADELHSLTCPFCKWHMKDECGYAHSDWEWPLPTAKKTYLNKIDNLLNFLGIDTTKKVFEILGARNGTN